MQKIEKRVRVLKVGNKSEEREFIIRNKPRCKYKCTFYLNEAL